LFCALPLPLPLFLAPLNFIVRNRKHLPDYRVELGGLFTHGYSNSSADEHFQYINHVVMICAAVANDPAVILLSRRKLAAVAERPSETLRVYTSLLRHFHSRYSAGASVKLFFAHCYPFLGRLGFGSGFLVATPLFFPVFLFNIFR
jgi:hypothetical protein